MTTSPPLPEGAASARRKRLVYIDDDVPEETTRLLREACERRDVDFVEVDTGAFDYALARPLDAGDMLYRPAVASSAIHVEQFLYADGVATFYTDPDGIYFDAWSSVYVHQRAGLPVPRAVHLNTTSRGHLERYAEYLGGFPIVAKFAGNAGGIGVLRIDSLPALYSFADYAVSQGKRPMLSTFIDRATHWRLVVVGDRVVGAYKNPMQSGDFRSYASEDRVDYVFPDDPEILDTAVRAVRALRVELGGVDVLEHPSGRHYLLEANFPCYFGSAQLLGGFDVAGAMVEHLAAKADRLAAEGAAR